MVISEISSIKNLRDLGGIATKDGRKVRQRCLLRSANLGAATEKDMLYLQQEYRLRTVIDLRTEQERMELPDYVGTLNYLTIPIIESFEAGITHEASTAFHKQ